MPGTTRGSAARGTTRRTPERRGRPITAPAPTVDFTALRALAVEAMRTAYVPYSKFPVGVAGLVEDGRIVTGCNVENASYGLTLCAECGMVSDLHRSGGGKLVAVSCVDGSGEPVTPCGRCRQLLYEHGGPECLVETDDGHTTVGDLLPGAFGPEHLA
jgi:cytidine deaminase